MWDMLLENRKYIILTVIIFILKQVYGIMHPKLGMEQKKKVIQNKVVIH